MACGLGNVGNNGTGFGGAVGGVMDRKPFKSMPLEQLWQLHGLINDVLAARILAKKDQLEQRLAMLKREERAPT